LTKQLLYGKEEFYSIDQESYVQATTEHQIEILTAKVKHYLLTSIGRLHDEASDEEFYRALVYALREEIMINWQACKRTHAQFDARQLYYLSLEYLPGRILSNNITNLAADAVVNGVLQKLNRRIHDIIARESDPGLGNGGLGRLASCFLDSLATHHYPVQAYGLRYQYGIFEQQLWDGQQIEAPDCWLLWQNPWEQRRDEHRVIVKYCGQPLPSTNIHGDEIMMLQNAEEVWALPFDTPIIGYNDNGHFSVATLRLWSTKESPKNFQLQSYNAGRLDQAAENTLLTDVLYPNDLHDVGKRIRLKQEFLLVSASVQDIIKRYRDKHDNFRAFADKVRIQINDTHPTLVIPELIRTLTKGYDLPWKMAVEITMAVTGYTNHTILNEALEQWDQSLIHYLLPRQYRIIEHLNQDFCNTVRSSHPNDEQLIHNTSILEEGKVRMANLAIIGCHKVNGVAKLHSSILREQLFRDFYTLYPDRFANITNGITQRRWLLHCNEELARFITRLIGKEWITDFTQIAKLKEHAAHHDQQQEFLAIKRKNKNLFIEFINSENRLRNAFGEIASCPPLLDIDALFDVQVKRIHEYKRQLLNILHLIALYQEMISNPAHNRIKRVAIFGGKAAAGYDIAKAVIRLIHCVGRKVNSDPALEGMLKIIYVENYNVSRAEMIIPAADLSEQISMAGMEASGTGNMKLAINGALTIGTDDGANIEMREAITDKWWPFAFGASAAEIHNMQQQHSYSPRSYYSADPRLCRAIDSLKDRSFAQNDQEHSIFCDLHNRLLEIDPYFCLYDFKSYWDAQQRAEQLFIQPGLWAEYALNNIASMGYFSSDRAVEEYSKLIWGLPPMAADPEIYSRVHHEYLALDVCRVY
jgi:starch phosphorylase